MSSSSSSSVTCITPVKLRETNFHTWSISVKQYLKNQNQLHYLNEIKPDFSNAVEYKQWKYDDDKILRSLLNSMEDSVYRMFRFCKSVSDLWVCLTVHFNDSGLLNFRKYQVFSEIHHTKQRKDQSLRDFSSKFWAQVRDLDLLFNQDIMYEALGLEAKKLWRQNQEFIFHLLCALHPVEHDPLVIIILDMNPLPSVDQISDFVIAYEEGRLHLPNMGTRSMSSDEHVNRTTYSGTGCIYCGHTGHTVSKCYEFRKYLVRTSARSTQPCVDAINDNTY